MQTRKQMIERIRDAAPTLPTSTLRAIEREILVRRLRASKVQYMIEKDRSRWAFLVNAGRDIGVGTKRKPKGSNDASAKEET